MGRLTLPSDPPDLAPEFAEWRYQAAERYAADVARYRATIGTPRIGVLAIEIAPTSLPAEDELPQDGIAQRFQCLAKSNGHCAAEPCSCAMRKRAYDASYVAVWKAGQRAAKTVSRVAVHREEPAPQDMIHLVLGLEALRLHYGLTIGRKIKHSRNAD